MHVTLHHFNFLSPLRLAIYLDAYEFFHFPSHSLDKKSTLPGHLYGCYSRVWLWDLLLPLEIGRAGSSCLPELALFLPHFRGKQGKSVFGTTLSLSVREHIICRTRLDADTLDLRRPLMWYSYSLTLKHEYMTFIVSVHWILT